jgi:hypothetical protein
MRLIGIESYAVETKRVDVAEEIVQHIGVAIPGLWIGGIDRGEAGGVG